MMRNCATQSLVLCCGLLVALPPGWCCFVLPATNVPARPPSVPPCPLCCKPTPAQPAPQHPEPAMPDTCPVCGERDLVKPAQPETPADISAAVLTVVVTADFSITTGGQF